MNRPAIVPADEPSLDERKIRLHGPDGFAGMRKAGRLAAQVLDFITPYVKPGVTTDRLDRLCHGFIVDHDAIPAPLNYRGFPRSICTSINHVVCHGIPSERRLVDEDILNIDVTVTSNLSVSVSTTPGFRGTAAIPSGSSSASAFVRPSIAHLVAQ